MALATLLKVIYYFTQDDPQQRMVRAVGINTSLTSKICRRLQDVCSVDLQIRPFIPFGGPGTVAKCDESKFNHKPKVKLVKAVLLYKNVFSISKKRKQISKKTKQNKNNNKKTDRKKSFKCFH